MVPEFAWKRTTRGAGFRVRMTSFTPAQTRVNLNRLDLKALEGQESFHLKTTLTDGSVISVFQRFNLHYWSFTLY